MKYKLVNKEIKSNYAKEYMETRGILDVEKYINPTPDCLQSPEAFDNIKEGAELLLKIINKKGRILLIVDSDNDGFTSSAIMYQYIKDLCKDIEIDYKIHEEKQHGLQDHMNYILDNTDKYDLIILPDSSSNDYEFHNQLAEFNIPCLVLDHHIIEEKISDNAIIINNQSSPLYKNKELTGAGVVYQFCRYLDNINHTDFAEKYIDLAAWGIIGDMGSLIDIENRYIIKKGLENVNNLFFKVLIDKQSYSMSGEITPITVAFYIVPLVNAMNRMGTMDEKRRMFLAFVDGDQLVPCNKRGAKGTMEKASIECARECTNARSHQNKLKEEVVGNLEIKIHKYDLLENKILFIRLDNEDQFPAVLNGLVAMQLSAKFKKPTIVARLNDQGFIRGSARGLNESELKSFKDFLNSTNMFEYTAGHDNAFGISIQDNNLFNFHQYANKQLNDIDFGENVYDVNFIRSASDKDLIPLISDLYKYRYLWGQNISEPLIYIHDIFIKTQDVQVIGKNSDTIKFEKNGIVYIKFRAKQLLEDLNKYEDMQINLIGRANMNEWMGNFTPQIFIEGYEIKNGDLAF